ncbi:MAG TPA: hypothetical protein VEU97_07185 [Ktedonobacteraceae bacterium]|nr:hypothetical protein [Ktedonobacteraceae bacterium]
MKNRSRQTYDGLTALSALRSKLDTDQDSDEYHNIDFALQSLEYEDGSITILVDDTYIDEKVSSYLIAKRRPSVRNIRVIEQRISPRTPMVVLISIRMDISAFPLICGMCILRLDISTLTSIIRTSMLFLGRNIQASKKGSPEC